MGGREQPSVVREGFLEGKAAFKEDEDSHPQRVTGRTLAAGRPWEDSRSPGSFPDGTAGARILGTGGHGGSDRLESDKKARRAALKRAQEETPKPAAGVGSGLGLWPTLRPGLVQPTPPRTPTAQLQQALSHLGASAHAVAPPKARPHSAGCHHPLRHLGLLSLPGPPGGALLSPWVSASMSSQPPGSPPLCPRDGTRTPLRC